MFERFTDRARQVVVLAQDEARGLKHNYVGTEHILLGLVREDEGVAARILLDFDADAEKIRAEVIRVLSRPARGRWTSPVRSWAQWQSLLTGAGLLGVGLAIGRVIWGWSCTTGS